MNKKQIEGFQERVSKVMQKLSIPKEQKETLIYLLDIEMKRPTLEDNFMERYLSILSSEGGLDI